MSGLRNLVSGGRLAAAVYEPPRTASVNTVHGRAPWCLRRASRDDSIEHGAVVAAQDDSVPSLRRSINDADDCGNHSFVGGPHPTCLADKREKIFGWQRFSL
jgi:hypothetical protein